MDLLDPIHDFEFKVCSIQPKITKWTGQIITNKLRNQQFELSFFPG